MSTKYCMNCGSKLEKEARFCTECGAPTRLGIEIGLAGPDDPNAVACPVCGVLNKAENQFCGACTAVMHPVNAAESEAESESGVSKRFKNMAEAPKSMLEALKNRSEKSNKKGEATRPSSSRKTRQTIKAPRSAKTTESANRAKIPAQKTRVMPVKDNVVTPKPWKGVVKRLSEALNGCGKALSDWFAHLDKKRVVPAAVAILAMLAIGLTVSGVFGDGPWGGWGAKDDTVQESPVQEDTGLGSVGVEVREGLDSYTWEELSTIAKEISKLDSRDKALAVAQEYHLVDDELHMLTDTKDVSLEGYGSFAVRLVDVYHDDLANGEGKAGLSFVAASLPLMHEMNALNGSEGGWEASDLRALLGDQIFKAMEEDLRSSIVAVSKHTNNVGYSTSESCVTATTDYLWLPSMVELMGPIDWTWNSDPESSAAFNAIANAEGSQYALFKEHNVAGLEAGELMQLENEDGVQAWWERSSVQSNFEYFRAVGYEGDPTNIYWADDPEVGVPISFCL